ncbi:MAG: hypothetical protein IPH05_18905 [Flavobacteriales bacterium]|nr:hypothetical protein [Flavobacteriales bacterium]
MKNIATNSDRTVSRLEQQHPAQPGSLDDTFGNDGKVTTDPERLATAEIQLPSI